MSTFYIDYIIFSDSEIIHIQLPYDNIHGLTEYKQSSTRQFTMSWLG